MEEPTIRCAAESDIPAILALWRNDDVPPSRTADAEGLRAVIAHPTSAVFVALTEGAIVGSVIAAWDGWRGAMYRLAVAPEHRRRRLGTALAERGEHHLRTLGARRIAVLVIDENAGAKAFWRSLGFEHQHRIARFVRRPT
jgi:ribosomal protein S18 acetylase RimI-like enzyme